MSSRDTYNYPENESSLKRETAVRIREMEDGAKPREKLLLNGVKSLTNAELLAILMRTGTSSLNVLDMAHRLLEKNGKSLSNLYDALPGSGYRMDISGFGQTKGVTLIAAMELGVRLQAERMEWHSRPDRISSGKDVYKVMYDRLYGLKEEQLWVLCLNAAGAVLGSERVSHGGIQETVADLRSIFKRVFAYSAPSIILVHNHPGGTTNPSRQDDSLTARVRDACSLLGIHLLDHIIFTDSEFYSYLSDDRLDRVTR